MAVRLLIEGRHGSDKTTLAARLADLLVERGVEVRGFVTHEVREGGRRIGFDLKTVDGKCATLAHVSLAGPPRVGKYGVDLEAFESIALPHTRETAAPRRSPDRRAGEEELASVRFRDAVSSLLDARVDLAATVHVSRHSFTDELKRRPDIERVDVTHANRDGLPEQLADRLSPERSARRGRGEAAS